MVDIDPSSSYSDALERVASMQPGQAMQQLVAALTAHREQNPGNVAPEAVMAEALGLWRLDQGPLAHQLLTPIEPLLVDNVTYWILRGMTARSLPDGSAAALDAYRQALALDGMRADLHYNLANLLRDTDPIAALKAYRRSLCLNPHQAPCWHNMSAVLHQQERSAEALVPLQISLRLDPLAANVWCDLGNILQSLDRLVAAQNAYRQAISLDRTHGASHVNLGAALVQGLQPEAALGFLQRGVELEKSSADSLWNLSLAHLQRGDYGPGWQLYDARLQVADCDIPLPPTSGPMPLSLADCPRSGDPQLVVWSEQGAGDAIQFCRYLPMLDAAGIPFEFRCRPELLPLFRDWLQLRDRAVLERHQPDRRDARPQIPLLSLPRLFGTELTTIPSVLPYLRATEPTPETLLVPPPPGGLAVGLVWASHAGNRKMYRRKSIPLAQLMSPLCALVDLDLIDLHCFQFGPDEAQLQPWSGHPRITNWAPRLNHFGDTAHVVNQMDLVISVDTAVAHLAGALRRPTWLLLPHAADFRWLQKREDSPWYPNSMRLFRQPSPGDWSGLVRQLQAALNALFLLDLEALAADTINK